MGTTLAGMIASRALILRSVKPTSAAGVAVATSAITQFTRMLYGLHSLAIVRTKDFTALFTAP
jgi:hypothetical protein